MPNNLAGLRPMLRSRLATAVHEAVTRHTGSDGFGHCFLYAVGGFALMAAEKVQPLPLIQGGSLRLQPDPSRPEDWFSLEANEGGPDRGEFHAWLMAEDGTIIDFSARHYRRYVESLPVHTGTFAPGPGSVLLSPRADRATWARTDPPDYLWTSAGKMPSWIRFNTEPTACQALIDRFTETFRDHEMVEFRKLVFRCLDQ